MRNDINTQHQESPITVIVAEKYPISRAGLAALLSYDGYRVFQAANARSAISHLNVPADLKVLLADLDMPDWQSMVRHATATTDALVIGLEGNMSFGKLYDLTGYGIRLCLQKPLRYKDVLRAIEENIQRPSVDGTHHRKAA
jgi:DNA-binding NtrC family response regulator